MNESVVMNQPQRKRGGIFISILLASMMVLMIFQTIMAQEGIRGNDSLPADLSSSDKSVSSSNAVPGSVVQYNIVLSNSGDLPAAGVVMTDTLTAGLTYEASSLNVVGGGLFGEDGGVITWTGSVNNGAEVVISFNAVLDGSLPGGAMVTNTAVINHDGSIIERSAVTTIMTDTFAYMPVINRSVPQPTIALVNITRPNSSNSWEVSWTVSDLTYVTGYELQEATNPNFENPTTINVAVGTNSAVRTKPLTINNLFYYRVRAVGEFGATPWSNVLQVRGGYRDDFNDPTSGWAMRRQDTDTVINNVFYRDGHLVLEQDSSYDYQIASSLSPAPAPPYQIESRVQWEGVDNLHSYGIIWGGDWNGQPCPNADYSSCFNVYYRLNVIWSGNSDQQLTIQLKRIDFHDPDDNVGRGVDLIETTTVDVNPPPQGYQTWAIQVYANGVMRLFLNGNMIREFFDTMYIQNPYFGAFSSTDEYNGLEAEFDYFQASFLD
jgi:uncharacterized repeat protein (TIGR01451 family)